VKYWCQKPPIRKFIPQVFDWWFFNMQKKAAIQLSVSIIVILILSIVIFSGGLYLVTKFFTFAQETQATITAQAQKEIENRLIQSGEPMNLPFNKKAILIGQSHAFGLGVMNTFQNTETFAITMSFSNAYDTSNPTNPIVDTDKGYINENWIFTEQPPILNLGRNEIEVVPLSVIVGSQMQSTTPTRRSTTYVFNVCVYPAEISSPGNSDLCSIDTPPPIPRDEIRTRLHGQKIGKIYVEVP